MKGKKIIVIISFIFAFLLLLGNNKIYAKSLSQLQAEYPTGSVWTGGSECHGFAITMYKEYYGISPSVYGVKVNSLDQIQAGDVVRYTGNMGHSVWVTGRNGNTVTVAEANYDLNNGIRWTTKYISEFSNLSYVYKAPYPIGSTPPTLKAPNNINATIVESIGIKISWDIVNGASEYDVRIYKASDVKRGDFSSPVATKTVKNVAKQNNSYTYIDVNEDGEFYAYVHTKVGYNISPNGGTPSKFTIKQISSITVTARETEVVQGSITSITAKYYPTDANINQIKFSSSDYTIATVNENGYVITKNAGTVTIYAKARNGVTGSVTIVVKSGIKVDAFDVTPGRKEIKVGQSFQITTSNFRPENATYKGVTWESYNENVAIVDEKGNVTGVGVGSTYIAAKASGALNTCLVIVKEGIPVTDISLNKTDINMTLGNTETITASVSPSNATNKTITWTTSDENIVSVNNGVITANGIGTATITAKNGNFIKTCTVRVYSACFKEKFIVLPKSIFGFIDLEMYEAELTNGETAKVDIISNNLCVLAGGSSISGQSGGFATINGYDDEYGQLTYICFVNDTILLSDGKYRFAGDLNGNNRFDSEDVTLLRQIINAGNLSDDNKKLCDINGDYKYDNSDVELLNRIVKEKLLTIEDIEISYIQLNEETLIMGDKKQYGIWANIYPQNTTQDKTLKYTSSDNSIAKIDNYGNITVLKPGTVKFTATTSNNKSDSLSYTFTYDDVTNKEKDPPVLSVRKSITWTTNEDIVVTVTANEQIQEVPGWTLSSDKLKLTKTFTSNATETIVVKDVFGNETVQTISVKNIDKTSPKVSVTKSITDLTNGNVLVTIKSNEIVQGVSGWTLSDDRLTLTKTYTSNTSEKVRVRDLTSNVTIVDINITNIDKTKPTLNVTKNITTSSNRNVIVTITSNEQIQAVSGWTLSSDKLKLTKTYTGNVNETITVKDLAGNASTAYINITDITNIDKTKPTLNVTKNITTSSNRNVIVTITSNEQIQAVSGWTLSSDKLKLVKIYNSNANETVTVKDLAGNEVSIKVVVDGILPFKDVKITSWYYGAVKYCYENKIINGTSYDTFSPNQNVTRGMLVTILYNMEKSPKVSGNMRFNDVLKGKYYYNAVLWASQNNIVNGISNTKFNPTANITRQDVASILKNYANYKKKYIKTEYNLMSYSDYKNISKYAKTAFEWAVANKIINGSSGKLNPKNTATRAEVTAMIYNYCKSFGI